MGLNGIVARAGTLLAVAGLVGTAAAQAPSDPVKRGEYLARAGDCISCHTKPGGEPYAGGLRMKTPFGDILAPNITPDRATGIGGWSADDLYRALHDGVGRTVGDLYPGDALYVFHQGDARRQRRHLRLSSPR